MYSITAAIIEEMWNSLEAVVIILFGMELYSCPVILVRLNCGDSLWLGNDTAISKKDEFKERESLTKRKKGLLICSNS